MRSSTVKLYFLQVGSMESCRLLVSAGADAGAADKLGRTPAALAKEMGLADMMHYLESLSK